MKNNRSKPRLYGLKCMKCPYYQGLIKCIKNPCTECIFSKRKIHPFTEFLFQNRCKEDE